LYLNKFAEFNQTSIIYDVFEFADYFRNILFFSFIRLFQEAR